jgi:hypothetical protein
MIKIVKLAEELDKTVNELLKLKGEKLQIDTHYSGYGKNTLFTEEGADLLRLAYEVPLAVPDLLQATVLSEARNPRWVYCKIVARDGKVAVAIPRKLRGKLLNKRIFIHEIKDADGGTTFRHEALSS